jgi:hypothetical protein
VQCSSTNSSNSKTEANKGQSFGNNTKAKKLIRNRQLLSISADVFATISVSARHQVPHIKLMMPNAYALTIGNSKAISGAPKYGNSSNAIKGIRPA